MPARHVPTLFSSRGSHAATLHPSSAAPRGSTPGDPQCPAPSPDDPFRPQRPQRPPSFPSSRATAPDQTSGASSASSDAIVAKAYGGKRQNHLAGSPRRREGSLQQDRQLAPRRDPRRLPQVPRGRQGPLTHPIGGGIYSLNVALRQMLDLYVCLRPRPAGSRASPAPVKRPQDCDMVIFRENTEDIYAGIEYAAGRRIHRKSSTSGRPQLPRSSPRSRRHRKGRGLASHARVRWRPQA